MKWKSLEYFMAFIIFFLFLFRYCTEIFDYLSLSAIIDGKVGSSFNQRIFICFAVRKTTRYIMWQRPKD
jgi:hypothetical protein